MIVISTFIVFIVGLIIYLKMKNIDPSKFDDVPSRLKFKPSSFSDDYVTPYFYHRYKWHPLLKLVKPATSLFGCFHIEDITYELGDGNFDMEKRKWATVGDCLRHNQEVNEELKKYYERLNKRLKADILERENKKKEAYKRANS